MQGDANYYFLLAYEFHQKNDLQKALENYEKGLLLDSANADVWNNIAVIYQTLQDFTNAKRCYLKALEVNTLHHDATNNLAKLYKQENELQKALICYERVTQLDPNNSQAFNNLGIIYQLKNDLLKAQNCYEKAIILDGKNSDAMSNLGVVYKENNDLQSAYEWYQKALMIDPKSIDTILNLSLLYLVQKEYEKGFELYRNRYIKFGAQFHGDKKLITSLDEAKGKKVLIVFEQGFGDAIQYSRFLSQLSSVDADIWVYIQKPLQRLFTLNFPEVNFVCEDAIEEFEYYFPMLDASYLLGLSYENIPYQKSYLHVSKDDLEIFMQKHHLHSHSRRIGFAFKGSVLHHNNTNRSINLEEFLEGLDGKKNSYFCLQHELSEDEKKILSRYGVIDLGSLIEDFYDTAVMVSAMDLIISVDSSLIHVSGALAKDSFLLVTYAPDWRWGVDDARTNWYESVRIFRQDKPFHWSGVLKETADAVGLYFDALTPYNLCALQFQTTSDYEQNLQTLLELVKKAPKKSVIVAPEVSLSGFSYDDFDTIALFSEYAKEQIAQLSSHKIIILTLIEKRDGAFYNMATLFYNGKILYQRAKAKLFAFGGEHHHFSHADDDEIVVVEIDGLKLGVLICFELRFKALWKKLEGADIIVVPSWWGALRSEHFKVLTQALAIMNQCYVIASDSANDECSKQSGVITPFGVESRNGDKPSLCVTYNKKEVQKMRRYLDVGIG